MKNRSQSFIMTLGVLGLVCLLQGCPAHKMMVISLSTSMTGTWEWVKTTTPTRTLTPQSVGYTKQLAVAIDNGQNYVGFYRNDTLQRRLDETGRDTTHTFVDVDRQTVLIKYGGAGFIKYQVGNTQHDMLIISEVLNPYTLQADTVHCVYQRTSKLLYPY